MKAIYAKYLVLILAASLLLPPFPAQASAEVKSTFLYNLANFYGKIPYSDVRIRVDRVRDEVYVVDRGIVRVFNETGMEMFWFGDDPELTAIYDLAVDEKGDLFLLSYDFSNPWDPKYCVDPVQLPRRRPKRNSRSRDSPRNSPGSSPITCFTGTDKFFFLSSSEMRVVVTDRKGVFLKGYNLADILEIPEKDRPNTEIFGFSLDPRGTCSSPCRCCSRRSWSPRTGRWRGLSGRPAPRPDCSGS